MARKSRREFLAGSARLATAGALAAAPVLPATERSPAPCDERISLNGRWWFRRDPGAAGESERWHEGESPQAGWTEVTVPHTWQIQPETADYYGVGWYRRTFEAPQRWRDGAVRIEFEAVFHSATVWINGRQAGRHDGKGYTAFSLDLSPLLQFGASNIIAVRVDNSFNEHMLPRGRSSDWAHDGGIYRPVSLLITPKVFIERVDVDALPDLTAGRARLELTVAVRNSAQEVWQGQAGYRVLDMETGLIVLEQRTDVSGSVAPGELRELALPPGAIGNPKLWHFDHPNLYQLTAELTSDGRATHSFASTFGVRSFEAKNGGFYLNGERVWLMGVERMAGSNPEFGMAEPSGWLVHDHEDLKHLNCVFTRVHWPQDQRVLDYCDRHGILIQTEVPSWGPDTFKGMGEEPAPEIMQNGLEQLREMIHRDRNHPSIVSWGLCNEIGGQNPTAYQFAQRMYEEARKLDPHRLRSYASNSLEQTPAKDVSQVMDFVEWNEYYGSWYKGTADDLRRNLEEIHQAFPGKPIVISEYGYCACTPERPEGDARRVEILREHDRIFREHEYVAGMIFFCYNDYRTHIGDKGSGVMKQRVHGVVDLYGARKPSYDALRSESSPVEALEIKGQPQAFTVTVLARKVAPAYRLEGYKLRAVAYGANSIPLERRVVELPRLHPGDQTAIPVPFAERHPARVEFDVLRPTGFSAYTKIWRP